MADGGTAAAVDPGRRFMYLDAIVTARSLVALIAETPSFFLRTDHMVGERAVLSDKVVVALHRVDDGHGRVEVLEEAARLG